MAPEALHTPMLPAQLTPVLPLQDPPTAAETRPPSLPPISVTSETDKHWTVTRHVFAAAYPRSRVGSYVDAKAGGELRSALDPGMRLSGPEIENKVAAMKDNQRGASLQGEKDAGHLWLAVNCYRPKRRQSTGVPKEKPGVTLILAHATGLHKETWEPALNRLVEEATPSHATVDEIWSLDLVNQGDSAILNTDHLGPSFDWMDVARDIANFVLRHLPQYTSGSSSIPYQEHLPTLNISCPDILRLHGSRAGQRYSGPAWRGRQIVLGGHSIGAASSAAACSFLPEGLVAGLILVDPTVQPLDLGGDELVMPLVKGALVRRALWSSKDEALSGFQKNKGFFGRWHPEALACYVNNALYSRADGKVSLKTQRKDEAVTFLDPNLRGSRACWNRLQYLPPNLRVHIILADPQVSVIQSRNISPERLLNELAVTAPTYQQLYGIHHMIVQEAPQIVAETIKNCLSSWLRQPLAHL